MFLSLLVEGPGWKAGYGGTGADSYGSVPNRQLGIRSLLGCYAISGKWLVPMGGSYTDDAMGEQRDSQRFKLPVMISLCACVRCVRMCVLCVCTFRIY